MAKRAGSNQDLLGIVAVGSIIGNMVQAKDNDQLLEELRRLQGAYDHMVRQYRTLYREFEANKSLTGELQRLVQEQRREISRLAQQAASKVSAK